MKLRNSLRFRVALAFAAIGVFFSLLLTTSLYFAIENVGHGLMDQSLKSELDQAINLQAHGEKIIFPSGVTIVGYVRHGKAPDPAIPDAIANQGPGHHNVTIKGIDYRVLVADNGSDRYFMLFDTDLQHEREGFWLYMLVAGGIVMTLLSAAGGFWLAMNIVTPVTRLVEQVGKASAEDVKLELTKLSREDEVGELARAFDRYAQRMQSFIEREKYFIGDVSHELRTPLAVILAAVEVLEQDKRVVEFQKVRVTRIKRAVLEANELCSALLLLAREQRPVADELSCVVEDVLQECIEKHRHLIESSRVALEVEVASSPRVEAERTLLEVVIGNLIRNAFSYTHSGSVSVRLEEKRLIVRDTGIGIRCDEIDRVFLPHYRGAASTGSGIGLSLVKRICDRLGWRILITSQENQGTTAEIIFSA